MNDSFPQQAVLVYTKHFSTLAAVYRKPPRGKLRLQRVLTFIYNNEQHMFPNEGFAWKKQSFLREPTTWDTFSYFGHKSQKDLSSSGKTESPLMPLVWEKAFELEATFIFICRTSPVAGDRGGRISSGQALAASSLSTPQETRPHTSFLYWDPHKTTWPSLAPSHM